LVFESSVVALVRLVCLVESLSSAVFFPCSSWVLPWLVFFLVFRFPRISIASLGFPSFRLVRFLSGWCFSCPSCRWVLVCFLVLLLVALPFLVGAWWCLGVGDGWCPLEGKDGMVLVSVGKHGMSIGMVGREVLVDWDGMVGKGIRVLPSWVGFSCLTVMFLTVDRE
jgi:hypothetical protein